MQLRDYIEMLNEKKSEMQAIINACRDEKRTMTDEEQTTFDALMKEVSELNKTIDSIQVAESLEISQQEPVDESVVDQDVKTFANMIRGSLEHSVVNTGEITKGANGDIIPTTIANRIIDRVTEISPIFNDITKYRSKGALWLPYIAASDDNIAANYATEFTSQTPTSVAFTSVKLGGHLVSVNTVISKSLINNTDIALTDFVIDKMAKAIANFVERESVIGTPTGATGLSTLEASQIITTVSAGEVKADDIIDLMAAVKTPYQQGAYFVMHSSTLTALRKLKDTNQHYLLNNDFASPFGFTLLGKPIFLSDNMDTIAVNKKVIYYGNFTEALAANIAEDFEIQILTEKYADQHAIGITGWMEFDEKIQNQQAVAGLKVKSS